MTQVMLKNEESQTVLLSIGGVAYEIHFYQFRTLTYIDVKKGKEYVLAGKRVLSNQWLIPRYVTAGSGNIRFETYSSDEDSYVWYEGFNTKYRLMAYGKKDLPDNYESE
ncbi:MAG: hypothetical protein J6Q22_10875 [Prevotella sp.]|nr:hypothetical protein [Prevotella sp.]